MERLFFGQYISARVKASVAFSKGTKAIRRTILCWSSYNWQTRVQLHNLIPIRQHAGWLSISQEPIRISDYPARHDVCPSQKLVSLPSLCAGWKKKVRILQLWILFPNPLRADEREKVGCSCAGREPPCLLFSGAAPVHQECWMAEHGHNSRQKWPFWSCLPSGVIESAVLMFN